MKEFRGFVANPEVGIYVPIGGNEIYRINAKRRLQKVTQFVNSVTGYMMVEHRGRLWLVHQLIYKTLHPEECQTGYENNLEIDHKDGDKTNNSIDNLRMITHRENMRNKIKRGGRQVTAHNPTTFETRIFLSIVDAARYINVQPHTIIKHLNIKVPCKGWLLTTNDATHRYTYIVDGTPVGSMHDVERLADVQRNWLYILFASPAYGSKIDINGHTIERIARKQHELIITTGVEYATPRRGRPRVTVDGIRV